jgi:hypothetical protein
MHWEFKYHSYFSPKASPAIFFFIINAIAIKIQITPTTMKAMDRK